MLKADEKAAAAELAAALDLTSAKLLGAVGLFASVAAIVTALVSEQFGWKPCALCYWQRAPYYIGAPIAAAALFAPISDGARRGLYWTAALCFAAGTALALYHSAVEFGWIGGLDSCGASTIVSTPSLSDFTAQTADQTFSFCGVRTPYLFGLTMTNWNVLASLEIMSLFAAAAWRSGRG